MWTVVKPGIIESDYGFPLRPMRVCGEEIDFAAAVTARSKFSSVTSLLW